MSSVDTMRLKGKRKWVTLSIWFCVSSFVLVSMCTPVRIMAVRDWTVVINSLWLAIPFSLWLRPCDNGPRLRVPRGCTWSEKNYNMQMALRGKSLKVAIESILINKARTLRNTNMGNGTLKAHILDIFWNDPQLILSRIQQDRKFRWEPFGPN